MLGFLDPRRCQAMLRDPHAFRLIEFRRELSLLSPDGDPTGWLRRRQLHLMLSLNLGPCYSSCLF